MGETAVYVPFDRLRCFVTDALIRMGVPSADAEIVTDVLLSADLYGIKSHGIARLRMYYQRIKNGQQKAVTDWTIVKETPATAVVDGGNGMGMVVAYHSMKLAIKKARQHGLGAVAVRNSGHYGIAGYYTRMAVREGMVGVALTNARPAIPPTFGVRPLLGTNPIAVSAPTDEAFPFTFDASTSIAPRGKIEVAARAGKQIPRGWVIRSDGSLPTDSTRIIEEMDRGEAALLPLGGAGEVMGGHKGYGLATVVEIFSAAFQDGAFLSELYDTDKNGNLRPLRIGHFFLAIDIESFVPLERFKNTAGRIMRELREQGGALGSERIYTAGEKAYYNSLRVMQEGVRIPPSLQRALRALIDELHIPDHGLGF